MNSFPLVHAPSAGTDATSKPLRGTQMIDGKSAALNVQTMGDLGGTPTPVSIQTTEEAATIAPSADPQALSVRSFVVAYDADFGGYMSLRTRSDAADASTPTGLGMLGVVSRPQGLNAAGQYDRLITVADNADAQAAAVVGLQGVIGRMQLFNGTTWDRLRSAAASVLAGFTSQGAALSAKPGNWAIEHRPAVTTQATITRAAGGAGVRHVCTSITASVVAVAAQTIIDVLLRDGATGAGTVLWSARMSVPAGESQVITLSDLNIVGSANTAMTLEFSGAPVATNFEGVALTGYDAS